MTFCIALRSSAGILALADTRIVRGSERLTKGKLAVTGGEGDEGVFFVASSGLRSVRDKLLIYAEEAIAERREGGSPPRRLHEVATLYGKQIRRVRDEDAEALGRSGLAFNAHAILGGRLPGDPAPTLFHLYPEGNWIEVADDSPWFMIGRTHYGRPILERLMHPDASAELMLALAVLAHDATAASVTDVGYPVDLLVLGTDGAHAEHRFERSDLEPVSRRWHDTLAEGIRRMPMDWAAPLLGTDRPRAPEPDPSGDDPDG